jgi:two-component system chemotaxis response regulator CheB
MTPTRVLVVDDSAVARRVLTEALVRHRGVEVVAAVGSGRIALDRLEQLAPDVVTLDVEMPGVGGLEVLRAIKARHPRLPVVMVSAHTERGAGVTIDALLLGADDYVTKPSGAPSAAAALDALSQRLGPKVVALHRARRATAKAPAVVAPRRAAAPGGSVAAVVVGASTGGPDALARLCAALPATAGSPVVIVQHMPELFTRLLAERLGRSCALEVSEAVEGDVVAPGRVLVAPGGRHLRLRVDAGSVVVALDDGPPVLSCRPSVDVTLLDAARVYADRLLAVVLTGMGKDGAAGASAVRSAGGRVLVQDAASSVVWGMPGAVVRAGAADAVLPLDALCAEVAQRLSVVRVAELRGAGA